MKTILYKRSKLNQVLIWKLEVNAIGTIIISYGLLDGKKQKEVISIQPKGGRTLKEQTELETNSLISKQKDKGYKDLEFLYSKIIKK